MNFGYMGLNSTYETKWADGRNVLIYPDGSVIDLNKGDYIRQPDNVGAKKSINPIEIPNLRNNQTLLLAGIFVLGLVAIIAVSRRN